MRGGGVRGLAGERYRILEDAALVDKDKGLNYIKKHGL